MANIQFQGTGRRKKSIARVRLVSGGSGKVIVNKRDVSDYFNYEILIQDLKRPLEVTNSLTKYDVYANVVGGGFTGQAGAVRHGIARALVKADQENKSILKKKGFLTRDSRMKERKKYGLKKARKSPQFSKR